jgi:hypothetical protein
MLSNALGRGARTRQHIPAKNIQSCDDRNTEKPRCQHRDQENAVSQRLIRMNRKSCTLANEGWISRVSEDGANDSHNQQDSKQHPCAPPCDRAGRDEQGEGDKHCISYEPEHDANHFAESVL